MVISVRYDAIYKTNDDRLCVTKLEFRDIGNDYLSKKMIISHLTLSMLVQYIYRHGGTKQFSLYKCCFAYPYNMIFLE